MKATDRRLDLLFTPDDPAADPRVYVGWQARRDPTTERRLLEEAVVHCAQLESFAPAFAAVVYATPA